MTASGAERGRAGCGGGGAASPGGLGASGGRSLANRRRTRPGLGCPRPSAVLRRPPSGRASALSRSGKPSISWPCAPGQRKRPERGAACPRVREESCPVGMPAAGAGDVGGGSPRILGAGPGRASVWWSFPSEPVSHAPPGAALQPGSAAGGTRQRAAVLALLQAI